MNDDTFFATLRRATDREAPPLLSPSDRAARVRAALRAADAPDEAPLPELPRAGWARAATPWLVAAAAAAAVLIAWSTAEPAPAPRRATRKPIPAPESAPGRIESARGDHVYAGVGARYTWTESDDARGVRLESGDVLCDVRSGHGRFEVHTARLTVRVLGTVFSVTERDAETTVRVYEGRVSVMDAGGRELAILEAGEVYGTAHAHPADPFAERGRALAAERSTRATTEPQRPRRRAAAPDLDAARAALARGDAAAARRMAQRALRSAPDADWLILRGDALRALDRPADAVGDYERAAARAPRRAVTIGYRIALTHARDLHDDDGALDALDRYGVDAPGSRLAERGLSLRIDATRAPAPRASAVRAYLDRFSDGPRAAALRRARAQARPRRSEDVSSTVGSRRADPRP